MHTRPQLRWRAWLCLAIYWFAGWMPAQGLKVCIGGDCGLALESLAGNCCTCVPHDGCGVECETTEVGDHGCDCTDIPVLSSRDDDVAQSTVDHGMDVEFPPVFTLLPVCVPPRCERLAEVALLPHAQSPPRPPADKQRPGAHALRL